MPASRLKNAWRLLHQGLWLLLAVAALLAALPAHATQTINGITINEDLVQARRGVAYSHTIPISGGTGPYTVTVLGGLVLPDHLTLSAAGVVSGVISCNEANGNTRQDIRITDSTSPTPIVADFTGSRGLAINVTAGPAGTCVALTIAPASLPNPAVGVAYNQTITASGGLAPYAYAVTAGALPAGMTLNGSTGQLSGTPTAGGAYSFTITATDAADSTGSRAYSGTVLAALTVNPATLPATTQGIAYSQAVSASGGTAPYSYTLVGSLPAGLSLNASTGAITGTTTAAGTFNFTINASDSAGAFGSRAYSMLVNTTMSLAPVSLPATTQGVAYSQTVSASGGTGAKTYAVTVGALPAGLSLTGATGAITGTASAAGTYNFTITATDSVGATVARAYSVAVNPTIIVNPASLPAATVGNLYSQTITTTGGTGATTFSVLGCCLPTGLSLHPATGAISGTPSAGGSFGFTIAATDAVGATGSRAYSVLVVAPLAVGTSSLPPTTVGVAYSQVLWATGGSGPLTWSSGSLPPGLTLATDGTLSGVPSTAGTFNLTVDVTDGVTVASAPLSLVVNPAIAVNPASLPNATLAVAYSQALSTTGGTGATAFAVSAGALPPGVSLSAAGVLSGTPTASGSFNFTVRATDTVAATGTRAYTLTVGAGVVVNPASLPATTAGVAYSQTITATGGNGSYTFSVSAGTLPAGLALNAASGALTGTPTGAGTTNFTVTATDGLGATGSRAYALTVNAALAVAPASLPATTQGLAYSQAVTASGGTGAPIYSVSAGALPTGLSLNAGTGAITGTTSAAGSFTFTITATDSIGASAAQAYTVTVGGSIAVNPPTLPAWTRGVAYSATVTAGGGTGAVVFGVSAGSLPTGLSLDGASGAITGTPSAAGTFNFTVTGTDSIGATGARAYSVTINAAPTVSPAVLPATTQGTAYSRTISASGGTGAFTFAVAAGSLPTGLSLNPATGVLAGTPSAAGSYGFTITATDAVGATASQAYAVTINAPVAVNPASLAAAAIGSAYSQTVIATGGTGAATFTVTAGSLPPGLSLNTNSGALTGTPSSSATFNFTVTATDTVGATGSRAYSLVVSAATLSIAPASLPATTQGLAYTQTVSAAGGTAPYTYAASGVLPTGLLLNTSTGAITGTATTAGTFNFSITATDSFGASGSRAFSVVVNPAIGVAPAALPNTTQGVAYSQSISASGGTGTLAYSVSAGALPTGVSLNAATGALTGAPSSAGTFNFTISAVDGLGATGTRAYTIVVNPPMTVAPVSLPTAPLTMPYSQPISTTGGTAPTTFAVTAGSLPPGVSLSVAGILSGTPTASGAFTFTVTATDAVGATAARAYTLTVNAGVVVNPASLPGTTAGVAYSQTMAATGGNGSYTFGVSAGVLPAGLSLSAVGGTLTGTPGAAGTFNFTVTATDGLGASGSRAYTLIVAAPIGLTPASLPAPSLGSPYSQTVTASGGTGARTYTITAGALPSGLTLNPATGALSGTPTAAGSFSFTITATDSVGATGSRAYSGLVNAAVAVNPASLPGGVVGTAYAQTINASGGNGSFTYSVTAGSLPAGLSLNAATGALAGTPTTASTSSFTVTATDGLGATGSRAYSVTVFAAMTINPATLPAGGVGTAYSQTVSVTGGAGGVTYAVAAGSLPAGLVLNATTGVLAGAPTAAGSANVTIVAADALGATASRAYTLTVHAAMALNPASLPAGMLGSAYSQFLAASGGSGTYTYAVSAGSLPPGFTLNASTGALAGTATSAGAFNVTITATDSVGATASRSYALTFNAAVAVGPATLPNPTVGSVYGQLVSGSGGTGAYAFTVTAGALPPGLALAPATTSAMRANASVQSAPTGMLAGTPTAAGTFDFTVTATDDLGFAGSRAYTLTVALPTLTMTGGVVNGAVGAPYSGVIGIAGGTAPYSYSVTAGQLPSGLALDSSTGALSGVPTVAGSYSFVVTVTDSFGATGTFTISIDVAPRPDPTQDPTVRSVHAAQVAAASRFGTAQLGNVNARMQMLHLGHDPCEFRFDVSTNVRWERTADVDRTRASEPEAPKSERKPGCDRALAVWAGGSIDFGFLRPHSAVNRSDFRTEGLTLGADARLADGLIVGGALGYGRDETETDALGSEARSHAQSLALYGSYQPLRSVFLDAVVGYGGLSFDLARWQADDRLLLTGDRSGSQWFASVGASTVLQSQGLKVAPYARIDHVRSRLDDYAERGSSGLRLAYDAASFSEDTLALGVYAGMSLRMGNAIVEPGVRVEQRRVRMGSADQALAYWDAPTSPYLLQQAADSENRTSGALSVMLRFGLAASLGLEYSYTGSSGTYRSETVRAVLRAGL